MKTARHVVALAALAVAVGRGQTPAAPSATELAQRVQAHYDTVRDFDADFTLSSRSAFAGKPLPGQKGHVQLKKPGRIFLKYSSTSDRYWADGRLFYQYQASVKTGTISALSPDDSSTPILFLMNRANLQRDFTPSVPAAQPDKEWQLVLTPKKPDAQVKTMTLVVDRTSMKLTGVVTVDAQNYTNTFSFQNLKENVGLQDGVFNSLRFPDGTQIVK